MDNKDDDYYLYEVLVFTGNSHGASCDSRVQIVVTGEDDETEVRTLDPGWNDTLRKGSADSYVMKVPRYDLSEKKYHKKTAGFNN